MVVDLEVVRTHIKPKADSTLRNMRKDDLIEYIRLLEYNHNVAVSFNEQQAQNFLKLCEGCGAKAGAKWVKGKGNTWECSKCGLMTVTAHDWINPIEEQEFFCAKCGARMEV